MRDGNGLGSILTRVMRILTILIPIVHILLTPYTKVEESFSLHATFDFLNHHLFIPYLLPRPISSLLSSSFPSLSSFIQPVYPSFHAALQSWDHVEFPGAVPRSFLPSLILASASYPIVAISNYFGLSSNSLHVQILVRIILAIFTSSSLIHLSTTISRLYSPLTSHFFLILSLSQFHIPFYAGRTLPNFFALPFVIFSISLLLRGRVFTALTILTSTATVIRLELALFLLPLALSLVILDRISIARAIIAGILGGFGSLFFSAPLDHTLWLPTHIPHFSRPDTLWPELAAAVFNVIHDASAAWGVSPWYWYATSALPKLLVGAAPLVLVAIWIGVNGKGLGVRVREIASVFGLSLITLIGGLSTIGHKEWRFIIYTIPIFNILASLSASFLWSLPSKSFRPLTRLALVGLVGVTILLTMFSSFVSRSNYPGGEVWKVLDNVVGDQPATIHFQSGPLQTGASLFTFIHASRPPHSFIPSTAPEWEWVYSKSEDPSLRTPRGAAKKKNIQWVVTDDWKDWVKLRKKKEEGDSGVSDQPDQSVWHVVAIIDGLDRVNLGGKYGLDVRWAEKLAILKRVK